MGEYRGSSMGYWGRGGWKNPPWQRFHTLRPPHPLPLDLPLIIISTLFTSLYTVNKSKVPFKYPIHIILYWKEWKENYFYLDTWSVPQHSSVWCLPLHTTPLPHLCLRRSPRSSHMLGTWQYTGKSPFQLYKYTILATTVPTYHRLKYSDNTKRELSNKVQLWISIYKLDLRIGDRCKFVSTKKTTHQSQWTTVWPWFVLFIWGFTSLSTLYSSYHDR